jgi:HAD superfamily hydrolase (TIGR01490 family)
VNYCAIFDLDETIIKSKSMIDALKVHFLRNSIIKKIGELRFKKFMKNIAIFSNNNNDRAALNKFYYRKLAGISADKIVEASQKWFSDYNNDIFNIEVIEEIRKHKNMSAEIIVVTGSFEECIEPIIKYLDLHHIICTQLKKDRNYYTGDMLNEPVIGEGKVRALLNYTNKYNISLENCCLYADHESDIPMLSLAKYPVVVGNNPLLLQHAKINNWSILSMKKKNYDEPRIL